jgi:hypothetical protein
MGEGDQGREHQAELSGSKHSALERCVVRHSKILAADVRFGSKADFGCLSLMSALLPKADIVGRGT